MSDYGFATYDEKSEKLNGSINSKWPIFGPKYSNIAKCYKTIHLSDTTEQGFITGNPATPSGTGSGYSNFWGTDKGYRKQLVYQYEHGLGFRPMGYAYFSGTVKRTSKLQVSQTESIGSGWSYGEFGGNFTLTGQTQEEVLARPDIKQQIIEGQDTGDYNFFAFDAVNTGYASSSYGATVKIPNDCLSMFVTTYTIIFYNSGVPLVPYVVEIDETYVKIYRYICWLDYKGRYKYTSSYSSAYDYDINQRIKAVNSYHGTELDCTVYLCPYKIGDLL